MNLSVEAEMANGSTEKSIQNAPRRTIDLQSLSLSSYIGLCTLISVCIGLAVSVLFFLLDIFGLNTSFQLGPFSFSDNESGIVVLFVGPFFFGVTGLFGSLLSYRLFLWALQKFWGLPLTGTWKVLGRSEESKSDHPPM
jgi:hypothetical protein